jgi:hypothetical protein
MRPPARPGDAGGAAPPASVLQHSPGRLAPGTGAGRGCLGPAGTEDYRCPLLVRVKPADCWAWAAGAAPARNVTSPAA